MANRKKKDEALAVVQAQTEGSGQPAVQSGYSAAGLDSRSEVENALANSSYKPSQTVTDKSTQFAFQVSPVGVEVGGRVAAYAEAGIGTSGCLLVGVRYRF